MFEHLLRPGQINKLEVRHRIMVAPMEKSMANTDGSLSERYIEYVRERAIGGASLVQLESTYVDEGGRGNPYQVGMHHDGTVPAMRRLADMLHEHGAQLSLELHHGGRQASPTASGRQPIAPSAIGSSTMGPGAIPREMNSTDIRNVIDAYQAAARRCLEAGVDMINLHGAHGYLLGQFLSPQSNHRTDEYGGSLENRARFPIEVYRAVREVVGPDYPIGYRISAVEFVPGGLELDEAVAFSIMLVDAGIDMIDVAGGTYESMAMIFQGPEAPRGGFIPFAAAIKRATGGRVPVGVAQRLNDPGFSEESVAENDIDFISMARGFHADPHFVRKLERGAPQDILPCIGCNACVWMSVGRTPVLCAANPHSNFEESRRMHPTDVAKRVLVIGGGVAGMHSARILARSGHDVTLVESADELGGQIRYGRITQPDQGDLADWLGRQLDKYGVDVRRGVTADADWVRAFDPDSIVVAAGAEGGDLRLRQTDGSVPHFDLFGAFDRKETEWKGSVAFTAGDAASCYLGLKLAAQGREVHMVDANSNFATDRPPPLDSAIVERMQAAGIHLHEESTAEILEDGQLICQQRGEQFKIRVDTIVVGGRNPRVRLLQELRLAGLRASIRSIGDGVKPRDVFWASSEAAEAAQEIAAEVTMQRAR